MNRVPGGAGFVFNLHRMTAPRICQFSTSDKDNWPIALAGIQDSVEAE
jgi:hypothetical protein